MLRIQVKAKQSGEWSAIQGIYRDDDFLIFVDFENRKENEIPDFYILNFKDWKDLLLKEKARNKDVKINEDKWTITYPDGWKDLKINPKKINEYKDRWDKIKDRM